MKIHRFIGLTLAASAALGSPAWVSRALADGPADVERKLAALEATVQAQQAELHQLRDNKSEQWLDERRAEEVKALVRDVLADADTRASLVSSGVTAGHNGTNFFLASEDGNFLLKIGGQIQARYTANFRNDRTGGSPTAGFDREEDGFSLRRAKLLFEGFIGSPKFEYRILLDVDRNTSLVGTQDLWIGYNPTDELKVWGGRFSDRFAREAIISSRVQQANDRSAVAYIWAGNDDNVEGVAAEWKVFPDWLIVAGTVNDGLNSGTDPAGPATNVGFQNTPHDFANDSTDIAFTGRADIKLAGDWKSAADIEAWSNAKGLQAFLGAGFHYEIGETGDKQSSSQFKVTSPDFGALTEQYDNFTQWTVDTLIKYEGFSLLASGYGWYIDTTDAASSGKGTIENYAATVQAGYFLIPDKLEPFARYEWVSIDDALGTNDLSLVTAGVNYFFKKHAAKFAVDAVWALNNINSANTLGTSLTGTGLLVDDADQKNQVTLRAQFQLLF